MTCHESRPRPVRARRKMLSGAAGAVAVLVGLLTWHAANADTSHTTSAPIVALGFDAQNHVLLKATAETLYRSADDGLHWTRIALPPGAHGRISAMATTARQAGLVYVGGPGLGVLRSGNDGRSWEGRNAGLPGRSVETVAVHADQADTVYAYVAGRGIFRSRQGGLNWRLMDRGPRENILQLIHSNMPGSMQTGWLFAATASGVRRSMDCFCGWRNAGGLDGKMNAVAYDPRQPQQIYAATGKEILLSSNGGEQWTPLNAPGPALTALLVTPDGVLYAAGGAAVYRSRDHAGTWERLDG